MKPMVSLIPVGIYSKMITNGPYSNYSTISMSDESLFLLELDITLASMSSKKDKVVSKSPCKGKYEQMKHEANYK